ncbi:MAG TPA: glycosyltransferase family 4 protein [Ignavibacteria bacterium]|mgnify:CR=1 FL=1
MRKVLVIAYYFPPLGLSGVQRTFKFVKYLSRFNWLPTILTISPGGYFAKDYGMLKEIEDQDISIVRVGSKLEPTQIFKKKDAIEMPHEFVRKFSSRLSQFFLLPDNKIGWKKKAIEAGSKLLENDKFDAIFSTAPPYTDFLIGEELKKKFNLPYVIDYRDSWMDNPYNFYPTPLHKSIVSRMERRVLHSSDHIITINRKIKELLLIRYKFLKYTDITIIPQGFDPEDFNIPENETLPKVKKFRITYSGTFIDKRTPKYFLRAVAKLLKENPEIRHNFEACFVGNFRKENEKIVDKLNLRDVVNIVGYVEHKECIKYLVTSDVLWMMIGEGKGEDMMSTGKLFEYIGAKKPILGCVPEGVAKNTILESKSGFVVDPYDVNGIAKILLDLFYRWKGGILPQPSDDFVNKYNRINLTSDLSRVFELLIDYSTFEKRTE